MQIVHFTQATRGRRVIARDEAERRRILTALARIAGDRLLFFCLVDDHLHVVLAGERLGLVIRDVRTVLVRVRTELELDPAHVKPVESRSHATALVRYVLEQPAKHHLAGVHPALFSGSCFQDLVGVRLLPGFNPCRLRAEFPRLSQRDFFPHVGLAAEVIRAATDDELRRVGVARIVELASATLAVDPDLRGREPTVIRARVLAARLAIRLDFAPREVSRYMAASVRTVQRLAGDGRNDTRTEFALRRRLTLEERVAGRRLQATGLPPRQKSG